MSIRPNTIKVLEENIGGKYLDISLGDDFLDLISKAKAIKSKNKPVKPPQTKKLLHGKGNHQQNKRQPTELEKISANQISDRRLIFKIYKRTHTTQQQKPQTIQLKNGQNI